MSFFRRTRSDTSELSALDEFFETQNSDERFFRERSMELLAQSYSENFSRDSLGSENMSLQSLSDLIRGGNKSVKREVIGRLKRRFTRDSVVLLRLAQKDSDYDVRYLATQALSYFEKRWLKEVKRLDLLASQKEFALEELHALVDSLMISYRTGLVDAKITLIYIETGKNLILRELGVHPKNTFLWRQLGKIRLQEGSYEEAIFCFDNAMAADPLWLSGWFWKSEVYFMQGNFPGLQDCCRELERRYEGVAGIPEDIREQVMFWLKREEK